MATPPEREKVVIRILEDPEAPGLLPDASIDSMRELDLEWAIEEGAIKPIVDPDTGRTIGREYTGYKRTTSEKS